MLKTAGYHTQHLQQAEATVSALKIGLRLGSTSGIALLKNLHSITANTDTMKTATHFESKKKKIGDEFRM